MIDYRFIVSDEDGELRRFATKVDALEFMKGCPEFTLRTLPPQKKINVFELVGECPF